MVYFIATIHKKEGEHLEKYEEYIRQVKPIVNKYGGRYLIRSNDITALQEVWIPRRVIIIEWETEEQLTRCFQSEEYKKIVGNREDSVDSRAIIVRSEE